MLLHIMQRGEAFDVDPWCATHDVTPPLPRRGGDGEEGRKREHMRRTPTMLCNDAHLPA
jgi:hypothetical protein